MEEPEDWRPRNATRRGNPCPKIGRVPVQVNRECHDKLAAKITSSWERYTSSKNLYVPLRGSVSYLRLGSEFKAGSCNVFRTSDVIGGGLLRHSGTLDVPRFDALRVF
jgi:hypothetical protein